MDKRFICTPVMDRIGNKLEYDALTGCYLWAGATGDSGYGVVNIGHSPSGKMARTHRVVWEHFNGAIPPGMVILHKCDTPLCCNPAHLKLGTKRENTHDMMRKGRHKSGVVWSSAA